MRKDRGQTLVEAVVAFGIAIMIVAALVAAATTAISRSQFAKHQAQARAYAMEGLEWVRAERDRNWSDFSAQAPVSTGDPPIVYCLNNPPDWIETPCTPTPIGEGDLFTRQASLTRVGVSGLNGRIRVAVTVTWTERGQTSRSTQTTDLSQWSR